MIRRLFIDIETTGLPLTKGFNQYYPYKITSHYDSSRMVSFSWLYTNNDDIKEFREVFIKPDNFQINNSKFHGIKQEFANKNGIDIRQVFEDFNYTLEHSDELLSYNVGFDFNVLCSELSRYEYNNMLETMEEIKKRCIMQECFDKGYISNGYRGKQNYMKLIDLHKKLFNEEFAAHNAYEDTYAAYRIFNKVLK